jgi:uncharacterized protein (UPF0264 family)
MPALLVSVRSAEEARAALAGGAAVIDVKEPARGPLGRADVSTWKAVVAAVQGAAPVSVALGELSEWPGALPVGPAEWAGLAFRKLGLASVGSDWRREWSGLVAAGPGGPHWIAVAYADWRAAAAPCPDEILDAALQEAGCRGILLDTWDKSRPSEVDLSWGPWVRRAQAGSLLVALAGGLDEAAIRRLTPLEPDLFAVRGAACGAAGRTGRIDTECVASLVRAID